MDSMRGKRILVIDDDADMLRLIEHTFLLVEAQVYTAINGQEGLRQLYAHQPHLVILDVMMPTLNGWEVCARIRHLSNVPIIFVTALARDEDIVRGLNGGAVDYVTKPFSAKVLLARAQAALRQAELAAGPQKPLTYNDDYLMVDLDRRQVLVSGEPVKLTGREYQLLAYLLQNADRVLTFEQILSNVWGWAYQDSVDYVHVYIWHLRQKLERDPKNPEYLLSEYGVGYCFKKLVHAEDA